MKIVAIRDVEYFVTEKWQELTFEQGINLAAFVYSNIPDRFRAYWDLINSLSGKAEDEDTKKKMLDFEMTITEEENFKIFPDFFGKCLALLSNIPQEIINFIDPVQRTVYFHQHLKSFVWGVMYEPYDFKAERIAYFEIKGEKYHLPAESNVLGTVRPMGDGTTAVEFCESADLLTFASELSGGKVSAMTNIVALLCRPAGEAYDEKKCLERVELFKKELDMKKVWEVFFCFRELYLLFTQRTTISFLEARLAKQKRPMKIPVFPALGG